MWNKVLKLHHFAYKIVVESTLKSTRSIPLKEYANGGAVAQSVEHVTPGEEVLGLIPTVAARSLWLGRCHYNVISWDSHGLLALSRVWQHVKLSDVSLGTLPRYSLVVDEDIKKPTNLPNKRICQHYCEYSLKILPNRT